MSRILKKNIIMKQVAKVTPDRIFSLAYHPTSHKFGNQVLLPDEEAEESALRKITILLSGKYPFAKSYLGFMIWPDKIEI